MNRLPPETIMELKRNLLVSSIVLATCLPYILAINRTATRSLIVYQGALVWLLTPILMTAFAKKWNCLIGSRLLLLRRRLPVEVCAITGALIFSLVVVKISGGKSWGHLMPIHLWTAMLPVYFAFLFITVAQMLRRSKVIAPKASEYLLQVKATLRSERVMVEVAEIIMFVSENHETVGYSCDKEYIIDFSLNKLGERLDPNFFFRSHRSYIINLPKVRGFSSESPEIKMTDGRIALVSKRNRGPLQRELTRLGS